MTFLKAYDIIIAWDGLPFIFCLSKHRVNSNTNFYIKLLFLYIFKYLFEKKIHFFEVLISSRVYYKFPNVL